MQQHGPPDLAILDGMQKLAAIFLSARIAPDDIAAGRALGATYLTKPFPLVPREKTSRPPPAYAA